MTEEHRDITQGDKAIYAEQGSITVNYGEKKIRKYLTGSPPRPEIFIGRDADTAAVHDKLFAGNQLLLLVNGQGGIGKTTLAAHYYHNNTDNYQHLAWVFAERSLLDAMLTLAPALAVKFPDDMPAEQRLPGLLAIMSELQKPCLLVIDNANKLQDLKSHYQALRCCPNFHILLTTRITEFQQAACHKIGALEPADAVTLFTRHYPGHLADENPLLENILSAVGYNTLVIELLAKNLNQSNRIKTHYTLDSLLSDLQQKGLLALKSKAVNTSYPAGDSALREATPETIIAAMYDLSQLSEVETTLLSIFAVLPVENITYDKLEMLLPDINELDTLLLTLAQKGWLELDLEAAKDLKVSPVIQEITRQKNQLRLQEDNEPLINSLIDKLEYEPGTGHFINVDYDIAVLLARYAESVLHRLTTSTANLANLCERLGRFHSTTGNLDSSLSYYQQFCQIEQELLELYPDNKEHKNNLAISFQYLGYIHTSLGNLDRALEFYEEYTRLEKELVEAYPDNDEYKNNLAISYSKLGETHTSQGNLDRALGFYEDETDLFKELYEAYPTNVSFKNGLAISYERLGDTHTSQGDLDRALGFYEEGSRLSQELYEAYPTNVSFKNGLAISYEKLGDTHTSQGNLDRALGFYEEQSRLSQELYEAYPTNVSFKNGLAISYEKLGDTHTSQGNLDRALGFYEERSRLGQELYEAYPTNVFFKNGLAISYIKLGSFYQQSKNPAKTKEYYLLAREHLTQLVDYSPQFVEFKNNLDWVVNKLAEL